MSKTFRKVLWPTGGLKPSEPTPPSPKTYLGQNGYLGNGSGGYRPCCCGCGSGNFRRYPTPPI